MVPVTQAQPNNPLHGVTLAAMLEALVARYGWDGLATRIRVRCFTFEPSMKSSLKFLRRTEWARQQVTELYLQGRGDELAAAESAEVLEGADGPAATEPEVPLDDARPSTEPANPASAAPKAS